MGTSAEGIDDGQLPGWGLPLRENGAQRPARFWLRISKVRGTWVRTFSRKDLFVFFAPGKKSHSHSWNPYYYQRAISMELLSRTVNQVLNSRTDTLDRQMASFRLPVIFWIGKAMQTRALCVAGANQIGSDYRGRHGRTEHCRWFLLAYPKTIRFRIGLIEETPCERWSATSALTLNYRENLVSIHKLFSRFDQSFWMIRTTPIIILSLLQR